MTKRMLIGMLVCTATLFGTVQVHGQDMGPGRWWRLPALAKDIGVTDKEKQALDDLFARNRDIFIDLKGSLEKERLKMEDILDKEPLNETDAKIQFKRVEEKRQKIAAERFNYIIGIRKILGSERFRILTGKFEEMKKKRFGEHGEGSLLREGK
jgi:Spy/CpxP family protein refolding chaperone